MQLARYMSVERYKDLLSTNTLFFPRYDGLSDKFEGSLAHVSPDKLQGEVTRQLRQGDMPWKFKALNLLEELEPMFYHSFLKDFTFVSCWHQSVEESFHMWQLYGERGIMIKSDLSSLKSSLGVSESGYQDPDRFWRRYSMGSLDGYEIFIEIDSIKYVPLGHEIKAIGTDRYFHKQQAYKDEKELRILLQLRLGGTQRFYFPLLLDHYRSPINGADMDNLIRKVWRDTERSYEKHASILNEKLIRLSKPDRRVRGVHCNVEINSLIKEIVVNPFSKDTDMQEIESLNWHYQVGADVNESVIVVDKPPLTTYSMPLSGSRSINFEL